MLIVQLGIRDFVMIYIISKSQYKVDYIVKTMMLAKEQSQHSN